MPKGTNSKTHILARAAAGAASKKNVGGGNKSSAVAVLRELAAIASAAPSAVRQRLKKKATSAAATGSGGGPRGLGMQVSSDGLNQSMTMVNNSRIEEKFQVRFEKVTDLVGTTSAFALLTNGQYFLNPGNASLFPIFSKIATTYEQYRVNRLRFHYVTQCYTASGTNVGAGRIMMATNFDPDASSFANKAQMENYEKCVAFEPYARHVVHDVMEARKSRMRDTAVNCFFVSGSANQLSPVTGQAKFYDVGNFQVAGSATVDATSTIGELWVEYSFTMIRPLQETPQGDSIAAAHYQVTPVTAASRFLSGAQQTGSNISLTLAANTITFPYAGNFLVVIRTVAATSYTDANTVSAGTNGTILSVWNADQTTGAQAPYGSGTATTLQSFVLSCSAPGVVVTWAGTPTIVGAVTGDVWVVQVPSDLITVLSPMQQLRSEIEALKALVRPTIVDDGEWECKGKDETVAPSVNMTSSFVRAVMDMAKVAK